MGGTKSGHRTPEQRSARGCYCKEPPRSDLRTESCGRHPHDLVNTCWRVSVFRMTFLRRALPHHRRVTGMKGGAQQSTQAPPAPAAAATREAVTGTAPTWTCNLPTLAAWQAASSSSKAPSFMNPCDGSPSRRTMSNEASGISSISISCMAPATVGPWVCATPAYAPGCVIIWSVCAICTCHSPRAHQRGHAKAIRRQVPG